MATSPWGNYNDILAKIKTMLPNGSSDFVTGAQNRYNQVMGSDYQAIPEAERQRMFQSRKTNLYKDVINPEDEKLAARMAISGQTGGGVGGGQWEDKSYQNKRLLSDVYNQIEDTNLNQTISDRNQAFNMSSSLAGMEQSQLNPWFAYGGMINEKETADRAARAQKKKNKGNLLGNLISLGSKFLPGPAKFL